MAVKPDEIIRLRNEGMSFALKIAREKGIDGLAEEVKKRGYLKCSIRHTPAELDKSCDNIAERIYNNMLTMVYAALHDVEGWGMVRLTRFKENFDRKVYGVGETDDMGHHWARFEDFAEEANRLYNFGIDLDKIRETQEINDSNSRREGIWIRADTAVGRLEELGFGDAAKALQMEVFGKE